MNGPSPQSDQLPTPITSEKYSPNPLFTYLLATDLLRRITNMALLMGLVSVGFILLAGLLGLATLGVYLRSPTPTQHPSILQPPLQVLYQGPEHDDPDETEIE
jgi:hypothetical protein